MYIKTFSVTEINEYIKKVFDNDYIMKNSSIKGEISNWKIHNSGHIYFSLKDGNSKINCIMFKGQTSNLNMMFEDGMQVIVTGRISTYVNGGTYQLYCENIKLEGIGKLFIEYEKLKKKLSYEGLFDDKYKKEIPVYASKIGVITSPTGAAIRDIINVTSRRNNGVDLIIYPSFVQGLNASSNLIQGIKYFNQREDIETIILSRGGGSIEELWAFNDEQLAREIFNSKIPIISGVGHETDYTISDFVSDLRASTPSSAAEIAVFNKNETLSVVNNYIDILGMNVNNNFQKKYNKFKILKEIINRKSPSNVISDYSNRLNNLNDLLFMKVNKKMDYKKNALEKIIVELVQKSPQEVLKRGYSVLLDSNGKLINNIDNLENDTLVEIVMQNGRKKVIIKNEH
ncbi:exodeoxyribonuclease VII large subunit [Clostridium sp. DL1XJH146]